MGVQSSVNQALTSVGVGAAAVKHLKNESKMAESKELKQLEEQDKLQGELVEVDRSELKLKNDELQNKWENRDLTAKMREDKELFKSGKMDAESYAKSRKEALRQQQLLKQQRLDFELQRQAITNRQSNIQQRLDLIGGKK